MREIIFWDGVIFCTYPCYVFIPLLQWGSERAEQHACASLKVIKGREILSMAPPPVRSIYENGWVCVKEQRATKALHQVRNLSDTTSSRNIGWWQDWGPPLQRHMQIHGQWQICEKGRWLPISFCVTLQMIFFMVFLVRNHIKNGVYCNQPPSTQRMKHTFFTKVTKHTIIRPQLAFLLPLLVLLMDPAFPVLQPLWAYPLPYSNQPCAFTRAVSSIQIAFFSSFSSCSAILCKWLLIFQDLTPM